MEGNNLIKKGVVVAVILLFIGLAFAPSINANISKASIDSELVEITTEVCGLKGGKHTVSLSKEDALEVEQLIDDIERRLDEVETREEAVEIFNEAVVELDKYGLLGSLSVEQVQRFVSGFNSNSRLVKFLDRLFKREVGEQNDVENYLCLVSTRVIDAIGRWFFLLLLYGGPPDAIVDALVYCFIYKPFCLFEMITAVDLSPFGGLQTEILSYYSIGLKGIKRGGEWGAIMGFTGIKLTKLTEPWYEEWNQWFFGFALGVSRSYR